MGAVLGAEGIAVVGWVDGTDVVGSSVVVNGVGESDGDMVGA